MNAPLRLFSSLRGIWKSYRIPHLLHLAADVDCFFSAADQIIGQTITCLERKTSYLADTTGVNH